MINDTQMDSGEKLQWECKAMGRPRPTYRWLRNGSPLTSEVTALRHFAIVFCAMKHLKFFDATAKNTDHALYHRVPSILF